MQRFLDRKIYVRCSNKEEVQQFFEMCKENNLHFTTRWNAEEQLENSVHSATFVYDWDAYLDDGVSFWSWATNGDGARLCIPFKQISPIDTPSSIDFSDFISLL